MNTRKLYENVGRRQPALEGRFGELADGEVLIRVALCDQVAHAVEIGANGQRAVVVNDQRDAAARLVAVLEKAWGVNENCPGPGVNSQHVEGRSQDDDKDAFVFAAPQFVEHAARPLIKRQLPNYWRDGLRQ